MFLVRGEGATANDDVSSLQKRRLDTRQITDNAEAKATYLPHRPAQNLAPVRRDQEHSVDALHGRGGERTS